MNADLRCKDVHLCLPDYLEGELSSEARSNVDVHLADCAECANEVAEMEATVRLLRGLPEPETPPMMAANVMRRIRAGETEPSGFERVRRALAGIFEPSFVLPASAMAVAALVVVVVQGPAGPGFFGGDAFGGGAPALDARAAGGRSAAVATLPDPARAPNSAQRVPIGRRVPPATVMRMEFVERQAYAERPVRMRQSAPTSALNAASGGYAAPTSGFVASEGAQPGMLVPHAGSAGPQAIPVAGPAPSPSLSMAMGFDAGLSRSVSRLSPDRSGDRSREGMSTGGVDSRDEWLAAGLRNPREFAHYLAGKSLAEQELWVERLATRAAERGLLGELVEAFVSTEDATAQILADDFLAVVGEPLDDLDR